MTAALAIRRLRMVRVVQPVKDGVIGVAPNNSGAVYLKYSSISIIFKGVTTSVPELYHVRKS